MITITTTHHSPCSPNPYHTPVKQLLLFPCLSVWQTIRLSPWFLFSATHAPWSFMSTAHSLYLNFLERTISCPMPTLHNPFCRLHTLLDLFWTVVTSWSCQLRTPCFRLRTHLDLSFRLSTIGYLSCQVCTLIDLACHLHLLLWPLMSPLHASWPLFSSSHILLLPFYTRAVIYFVECTRFLIYAIDRTRPLISVFERAHTMISLVVCALPSFLFSGAHQRGQGSHGYTQR